VWDVDVAIADGCRPNPEAVSVWRREHQVVRPPAPWPAAWSSRSESDIVFAVRAALEVIARMRSRRISATES
jgi:hypothetical protein